MYADILHWEIELCGTVTGEHGIGLGKREYMVPEHEAAQVVEMRPIKDVFDPTEILNPGNIFPEERR